MKMNKEQLVTYIMCLEHNNNALFETLNQQAVNTLKIIEEFGK